MIPLAAPMAGIRPMLAMGAEVPGCPSDRARFPGKRAGTATTPTAGAANAGEDQAPVVRRAGEAPARPKLGTEPATDPAAIRGSPDVACCLPPAATAAPGVARAARDAGAASGFRAHGIGALRIASRPGGWRSAVDPVAAMGRRLDHDGDCGFRCRVSMRGPNPIFGACLPSGCSGSRPPAHGAAGWFPRAPCASRPGGSEIMMDLTFARDAPVRDAPVRDVPVRDAPVRDVCIVEGR